MGKNGVWARLYDRLTTNLLATISALVFILLDAHLRFLNSECMVNIWKAEYPGHCCHRS